MVLQVRQAQQVPLVHKARPVQQEPLAQLEFLEHLALLVLLVHQARKALPVPPEQRVRKVRSA